MPCRGGGGGEEKGGGGVGWRGGGVAKYNGVVKVQLRMCWVLLLLCVLLALVGLVSLFSKMRRGLNVAAARFGELNFIGGLFRQSLDYGHLERWSRPPYDL